MATANGEMLERLTEPVPKTGVGQRYRGFKFPRLSTAIQTLTPH